MLSFFKSTFKELGKLLNKSKIIVGEFNVILNTDIDIFGGNLRTEQNAQKHYSK